MESFILYTGNKNYSSWSLRLWLGMKFLGFDFEEVIIPLYVEGQKERSFKVSPSGKVPCLHHNGFMIWDSLAILEYINELVPEKNFLPKDSRSKALARSVIAEMHSGFLNLRKECPMNMRRRVKKELSSDALEDLVRIYELWDYCKKYTNYCNFLFGDEFNMVDAFYAPIVSRIISYDLLRGNHSEYIERIANLDIYKLWEKEAIKESWVIEVY